MSVMTEDSRSMSMSMSTDTMLEKKIAEPLFIQRLEAALDMQPFMDYARKILSQPLTSSEESDLDDDLLAQGQDDIGDLSNSPKKRKPKKLLGTKEERQFDKSQLYNFTDLPPDREWLYQTILSDTESDTEISDEDDYIKEMLRTHVKEQKMRENFYKKNNNTQYAYLGAGMLSNTDMFSEHQQSVVGVRKRKRRVRKEKPAKLVPKIPKMTKSGKVRKPRRKKQPEQPEPGEIHPSQLKHYAFGDTTVEDEENENEKVSSNDDTETLTSNMDLSQSGAASSNRGRKKRGTSNARTPAALAAKRKRVWQLMAKKELGRCHRAKANNHKEMLTNCKKVAGMCAKVVRQKATVSQKIMKETVWRAKRLTREMVSYWKRYERVERDMRRRMEKEAEEQRKIDVEYIEAKRQQRKLNFLITQTELYAHFMSKKLGQGTEEEQLRILNQLDEEVNPRLAVYDDYDAEEMKQLAQKNAEHAFCADKAKTKQFDVSHMLKEKPNVCEEVKKEEKEDEELDMENEGDDQEGKIKLKSIGPPAIADLPQPKIFKGTLKAYQIKGMTWLANLYDQGISGILADEMGLGKTVQSIAFLCHIAEHYGVWGPFLVISPASTLHNWQQEMQRFVPDFNVVPYWGSPNERKILRQFWEQKDLHTKEASFHVVITSYQLIVSDYKYFNRIKWQYMVLDEAQAIKSATSMRWKLLLGFNCRNRLLLSGTPIQNSMAELWALLHFIMPTLFDSHDEFNEWFSKDIESHAENKTGIDEKQISRLHMILKPFMLRRIKKDVENELSDKIEIMVYCPLTIRQKLLYMALKKKINIEDLLNLTGGGAGSSGGDNSHVDRNFTSNLMNLVMQFRKVCNHPELFERRDAKSPFAMTCSEYILPRLCFDEALFHRSLPSKNHLLYNKFSIFKAAYSQHSLFQEKVRKISDKYPRYVDLNMTDCCFSFARLSDLSPKDLEDVTINGLITLLQHYRKILKLYEVLAYRWTWWPDFQSTRYQLLEPLQKSILLRFNSNQNSVLKHLIFTGMTSNDSTVYAFGDYTTTNMQETIEHRIIRSKLLNADNKRPLIEELEELNEIKTELDEDLLGDSSQISASSGKSKKDSNAKESSKTTLLPEFPHETRKPTLYRCEPLDMPRFLYNLSQRVQATKRRLYCESRAAEWSYIRHTQCENVDGLELLNTGLSLCKPHSGWSSIVVPDKESLITDAGKLAVLDSLLTRLKAQGHRVLIYSQMTKMIDLLEEYMWHRKHRYMRLDGSSKISARRDMVADFQTRADIFVFLLSTRAGGLGINLTAADTVIFYDSDWNPTVDQQAMDRAHRLGQTKQVTVYRLICKGTIEERILQRAREKSEIQRMVISGGNFKPDTLKPKEVVSLLLDDEEIDHKYRQKVEPSNDSSQGGSSQSSSKDSQPANERKRRKQNNAGGGNDDSEFGWPSQNAKRMKFDQQQQQQQQAQGLEYDSMEDSMSQLISNHSSPSHSAQNGANYNETFVPGATSILRNDDSENESSIVDCESGVQSPTLFDDYGSIGRIRRRHHPRGTRRGRPRGLNRRGGGNGGMPRSLNSSGDISTATEDAQLGETPKKSHSSMEREEATFSRRIPAPVKRGPGRPRIKTTGPVNVGLRGTTRIRKPIGPLVVPLGNSPAATPLNRSPTMSPAPSPAHSERSNQSAASTNLSINGNSNGANGNSTSSQ